MLHQGRPVKVHAVDIIDDGSDCEQFVLGYRRQRMEEFLTDSVSVIREFLDECDDRFGQELRIIE